MPSTAPNSVTIRPIAPPETHPIRRSVLRPDLSDTELNYAGDTEPESLHIGAYLAGEHVGIATVYHAPAPGSNDAGEWRLRGMATIPRVQGMGVGAMILDYAIGYVANRGGRTLWCDARKHAAGFYQKYGFAIRSEEYNIPNVGPHYRMFRDITRNDQARFRLPSVTRALGSV